MNIILKIANFLIGLIMLIPYALYKGFRFIYGLGEDILDEIAFDRELAKKLNLLRAEMEKRSFINDEEV